MWALIILFLSVLIICGLIAKMAEKEMEITRLEKALYDIDTSWQKTVDMLNEVIEIYEKRAMINQAFAQYQNGEWQDIDEVIREYEFKPETF